MVWGKEMMEGAGYEEEPSERECDWCWVSSSWPPPTMKWEEEDGICGSTAGKADYCGGRRDGGGYEVGVTRKLFVCKCQRRVPRLWQVYRRLHGHK